MTTQNTNTQVALKEFVRKPEIMASFERILGDRDAEAYVQSVLIAVSASDDLMKCTNPSIYRAALRAASLGLSCDPALKQAWLVPYNKNIGSKDNPQWVKEAQFQPHYKGYYTLAMRTNKYAEIEVIPIGAGYTVEMSVEHGIVIIHEATGKPAVTLPKVKPSEAKIWFAWFRTTRGFVKKVWMTVEEIHAHAKQFNPKGYEGKGSPWQKPEMRPYMEMKTVLRNLLSWADLSGKESAKLAEALQADAEPVIDAQPEEVVTTYASDNGNPDPVKDKTWKEYEELIKKADSLQVPHADTTRDTITEPDLQAYMKELLPYVLDAEAQAQAA